MELKLIKRKPPIGADECWVLDHYAAPGGRTELTELFTDAKYRHPAGGAQLGNRLAETVRVCAPNTSWLKRADKVVAIPSSRSLARQLAAALALELGLDRPANDDLAWARPVPSMKSFLAAERAAQLDRAMTAAPISGGSVVLVDDLMESLATFAEASRAVRLAGADRVTCIALVLIDRDL